MTDDKNPCLNNTGGTCSYDRLLKDRKSFADKTDFIRLLNENSMSPCPVLLRPHGFGKSTFVSMLKCFYDISYIDRYGELFEGTAVYTPELPAHNTCHVIDFDFSGISGSTSEVLVNSFIIAISRGIDNFKKRYRDFVFNPGEREKQTPFRIVYIISVGIRTVYT